MSYNKKKSKSKRVNIQELFSMGLRFSDVIFLDHLKHATCVVKFIQLMCLDLLRILQQTSATSSRALAFRRVMNRYKINFSTMSFRKEKSKLKNSTWYSVKCFYWFECCVCLFNDSVFTGLFSVHKTFFFAVWITT